MLEETLIKWRDMVLQEGREEGRQEGRLEGRLEAHREVLLEQMALRFGRLPAQVRRQLETITSVKELEKLTRRVLTAKSLEEMGFRSPRRPARSSRKRP